jgi:hypothetical protein
MTHRNSTHRRAFEGTLIVRVSLVALGIAASVGLQLAEPESRAPATWTASNPSVLCTVEANGPLGLQPGLQ